MSKEVWVVTVLALGALAACSRQPGNFSSAASLQGCNKDEQCTSGELCVFRLCTPRCGDDRSCDHGASCFDTRSGPACVLRDYNACVDDSDCPLSTTCEDSRCKSDCEPDAGGACSDCVNGLCISSDAPRTLDAGAADAGMSTTCPANTSQCRGNMAIQCDAQGRAQPREACPYACKDGACVGTCKPGDVRCDALERERCDDTGAWQTLERCTTMCMPDACETACVNGTRICSDKAVSVCRAGRMLTLATCDYVCRAGACSGECTPGSHQCRGTSVVTCNADGAWDSPMECPNTCNEGACSGMCDPGDAQCTGPNAYQVCDRRGAWSADISCRDRACVGGMCTGTCAPGTTRCEDAASLSTCGPDGQWASQVECPTGACTNDACTEGCAPGNLRCLPGDASQPQRCGDDGKWQNSARCAPMQACVEGACRGECGPGMRRCTPDDPRSFQACGDAGEWQSPTACGPDQRCAGEGECGLGNTCPPGQSPAWWDGGDEVDRSATDPRWGDTLESFATNSQDMPAGYAIVFDRSANALLVTIRTDTDDTAADSDFVYFGIAGPMGSMLMPQAVRIALPSGMGGNDPRMLMQITSFTFAMGTWMNMGTPPWVQHAAAWVSSLDRGWAVSFRVDLSAAGVDAAMPFRIALGCHAENDFGQLDWATPGSLALSDLSNAQPRTWPMLDVRTVTCASRVDVP